MVKKSVVNIVRRYRKVLEDCGVPVAQIFLFGSYVRGDYRKDSDIDVCVVSPMFQDNPLIDKRKIAGLGLQLDTRIHSFPVSLRKFKRDKLSPLLHEIRKNSLQIK